VQRTGFSFTLLRGCVISSGSGKEGEELYYNARGEGNRRSIRGTGAKGKGGLGEEQVESIGREPCT